MLALDRVNLRQVLSGMVLLSVLAIGIETFTFTELKPRFPKLSDGQAPDSTPAVVQVLHHWDSAWYASIATEGYFFVPDQQSSVAFFPLYPLTIRGLMLLGFSPYVAGELVTLFAAYLGCALFFLWARRVKPEAAGLAVLLLLLYPFSIYLHGIVYSDALYLLCAVAAFYSLENDWPFFAALCGALGTACRPIAPALVIGLLVRSLERRKTWENIRLRDFVPALAGCGLLAYLVYLHFTFDDALAFAHVEGAKGWDHTPGWATWLKFEWFRVMFPRVSPLVAVRLGTHAFITLAALLLSLVTMRKVSFGYGLYCLIAIGIPALSSKDFQGLGRYSLAAFPLFVTLSVLLEPHRIAKWLVTALFAFGFLYCAVAWGFGGFVA
jgi:hypothetical protein